MTEIEQGETRKVFTLLSIGANLGKREETIKAAISQLNDNGILSEIKFSSAYETEPIGYRFQPWFLNIAISGYTAFSLEKLFEKCKNIEQLLGRKHREQWHEREIDIDVLLYGDICVNSSDVTIPHPKMHERRFVLIPAAEIAGDAVHPGNRKTINKLLEECTDKSKVQKVTI